MADPDWTDPCAVAAWIYPRLAAVAAGTAVFTIHKGDSETRYHQGNVAALQDLYRQAVADCAKKTGDKTLRRRPFIAG